MNKELEKIMARIPLAVDPFEICESEEDKQERALGIELLLLDDVTGKSFLDVGCGEGHLINHLSKKTKRAVGYDLIADPRWDGFKGDFTTKLDNLNGQQFDRICLFDVLDHADDPVGLLKQVKILAHDETKIVVRVHPWCSRHGGHIYKEYNKGWAHLILTDEELSSLNLSPVCKHKVIHPLNHYSSWFTQSGYKVINHIVTSQPYHKFLENNNFVRNRITRHWAKSADKHARKFPKKQISMEFVDYYLTK